MTDSQILPSGRAPQRRTPVRPLSAGLFLVSCLFILSNFDFGFRVTADQRLFTDWALTLSPWDWINKGISGAYIQGRIAPAIVWPLQILGERLGDAWAYPYFCIGIFVAIFVLFYVWIQSVCGSKVALALAAVYLALLPAGLHHWLPNAYPIQFLPLAFALFCRHTFQRLYSAPKFGLWWKGVLAFGIFVGAVSYELSLVLLICMATFEVYAYLFIEASGQKPIAVGYLFWQNGIVATALAGYVVWRFLYPSHYPGNEFPIDPVAYQAKVTLLHLYRAVSISRLRIDWAHLPAEIPHAAEAVFILVILSGVISASRPEALPWKSLAVFGGIVATVTTIPIAANHKYVDWCLGPYKECTYIDARFSLLGIALLVFCAAWGLLPRSVFRFGFALAVGTIGALTFLANADAQNELRLVNGADFAAKAHVCKAEKQETGDAGLIERLIIIDTKSPWGTFDPRHNDNAYKVKYWERFLKHLQDDYSPFWLCGWRTYSPYRQEIPRAQSAPGLDGE